MKALEQGQIVELITQRIQLKTKEKEEIEKQISLEEMGQVSITFPEIKFFLTQLKNGNINDLKYRKTLINVFVNAIYLYDDKITYIFNAAETPVTVDVKLLDEIEQSSNEVMKSSCLGNNAPPGKIAYEARFYATSWAIAMSFSL